MRRRCSGPVPRVCGSSRQPGEWSQPVGLITAFDAIHDQPQPLIALQAIADALRPGGTFLMVDMAASSRFEENLDHPLSPILYTFSCLRRVPVSRSQGGEGLGAGWGEQTARDLLDRVGFDSIEVKHVDGDLFNSYYVASRAA